MIQILATLALLGPVNLQDPPAPEAQRVKAAVAELEKAFKDGETAVRVKAIENGAQVVDAQVIACLSKGLRDRESQVQKSAIEALRFMNHPDALKALEQTARQDKKIAKDVDLFTALLRAIGQHAHPSSIAILADDVWAVPDNGVIQARILGLGRIRANAAVEALFDLMKVAGSLKMQPFMDDFRLALMVLTSADQGTSQELWQRWWNENRSKLKVAPQAPELPPMLQRKWNYYWGLYTREERQRKRSERGKDNPERGGGGKQ